MAKTDVSGFNGSVSLTGHGGDAHAFTFGVTQAKKNTSRYGGTRWSKNRGGVLSVAGSITVFLTMAASGTAPAVATLEKDGTAMVLTAETGCTWTGSGIIDFSTNHSFGDPAIEGTYNFEGTGDWTEAWAAT
jgi:hypothetical protein